MSRFKNIHAGDILPLLYKGEKIDNKYQEYWKEWKVKKVYTNVILCECNGIRECFTYGEMVQAGIEGRKAEGG